MQSLTWYYHRLRHMTPAEIAWRVYALLRDRLLDRLRLLLRLYPRLPAGALDARAGFRLDHLPAAALRGRTSSTMADAPNDANMPISKGQLEALLERAEGICAHRLSFFGLTDVFVGDPIDWHRDHASHRRAPRGYSADIDYRDFRVTGDCKLVWELNRHYHLVVLARAWRCTGERRYAEALVKQLDEWLDANPFGYGMNWRSPLELGVRLINWIWAIDLLRDRHPLEPRWLARVLKSVHLHCWEIQRKYSRGSSANNHLIGEAAGVYIACAYFPQLPASARWRAQAHAILSEEIERQTWPDGGSREQAVGYQIFVMQFFLLAGLVARAIGEDFPPRYWQRLERMAEFLAALAEGGERMPMFGDADDGYVLDLGDDPRDARPWLAVAAVLFARPDFKITAGPCPETLAWLLGPAGCADYAQLGYTCSPSAGVPLASRAFPDSGYYLLQGGAGKQRISVVFDCGELGYGPIAAHGHADALSFTLRIAGRDVLVDPGTYDYFSYPHWRRYFRSTRAHNTVVIDGEDQSEMLGPFLWGQRAPARCLAWRPHPEGGGCVVAEHDGYERLPDPVGHRRCLALDIERQTLVIEDELSARGVHSIEIFFHLAEDCRLVSLDDNRFHILTGAGQTWQLALDPRLTVKILVGSEDPTGGWVSRGYHRRQMSTTLCGQLCAEGSIRLVSRLERVGAEEY